jgi:SAM-dependent methyltransferase
MAEVRDAPVRECLGCGRGLHVILDLGRQPLAERDDGHRYPLGLQECGDCGLVQATHYVRREDVFPPDHPYVTGSTAALRLHFEGLARVVEAMTGPGDLVIDIGANDGTFLAALRRLEPRVRVLAVEPTNAARLARAKNVPVEQEFWSRPLAAGTVTSLGKARVVTASNVMAHCADIHEFIDAVKTVLTDDGTFICENHDFASVEAGLQVDTVYHEHLLYFTPATLGRLLEQHGFTVSRIEQTVTHGGSFRTYATRRPGNLQQRADTARDLLFRLLEIASEEGPVYGVGAATRATPLIHFAGLQKWLTMVVEVPGHPKIGSTIPGTLIPVADEKALIEAQPPTALLLCWHVADSVVPKLRAAGYAGKFIIPLPRAGYYRG